MKPDLQKLIQEGIQLWDEFGKFDTKGELKEHLTELKEVATELTEKFPIAKQFLGLLGNQLNSKPDDDKQQ